MLCEIGLILKMADDQRRRVRDISECSETELNPAEGSGANLTQCESEAGTLSQSITAASELDDTGDLEDVSDGESEEGTDAEEEARYAADDAEHDTVSGSGDSETEGEDSEVEVDALKKETGDPESGECTATEEEAGSDEEEVWKNERRHSGDGEEQKEAAGEKCDIDDDRTNPAFIPRKGMFYEHDMRLGDENEKEIDTTKNKKKLWIESHKWDHDRFDASSQAPKSKGEIVGIYGYDIRLDNSPPKYMPNRSRGNRRQRGSRKLGDFIQQRDQLDSDHNDDSDVHSHSGHIPNRSRYHRSSGGDDSGSYASREPRRSGRGSQASRANRGNRGRYSDMRQQRGQRLDSDRISSASSNDESSYQEETHGRRQGDSRETSNRRGAIDSRLNNFRAHGYQNDRNQRNRQNERQRGSASQSNRNQTNAESRDDEEIAKYSENMYAKSRDNGHESGRAQEYKNEPSSQNWEQRRPGGKEYVQTRFESEASKGNQKVSNYHTTRIISSSHYKHPDSATVHDRSSQIQGVVASMEKISLGKSASSDSSSRVHSGPNGSWKTTRTLNTSDVGSENIPPVTRPYTRTVQTAASDVASVHLPSSREIFMSLPDAVPRPPPSQSSYEMAFRPVSKTTAAVSQLTQQQQLLLQTSKPKRYSTQRQRGQPETEDSLGVPEVVPEPLNVPPSNVAGVSLPPRLLRSKYQDEEVLRQHMLQYPSRSVITTRTPVNGVGNVPYSETGIPPSHYYPPPPEVQSHASDNAPTTMMHPTRYLAPRHIIQTAQPPPGQYYSQQPMYNYVPVQATYIPTPQSHYRMPAPNQMRPYIAPAPNPQIMSEVSPSMEVRGGTVYFNAETQQPELRVGGIYYGPAGQQGGGTVMQAHRPSSAIPIVHPQELGGGDGPGYYPDTGEYAPYGHYISSPVPYDASPMCMPTEGAADGPYA